MRACRPSCRTSNARTLQHTADGVRAAAAHSGTNRDAAAAIHANGDANPYNHADGDSNSYPDPNRDSDAIANTDARSLQ
jgi:hypothetical protein